MVSIAKKKNFLLNITVEIRFDCEYNPELKFLSSRCSTTSSTSLVIPTKKKIWLSKRVLFFFLCFVIDCRDCDYDGRHDNTRQQEMERERIGRGEEEGEAGRERQDSYDKRQTRHDGLNSLVLGFRFLVLALWSFFFSSCPY
jgi:hypothetical protein